MSKKINDYNVVTKTRIDWRYNEVADTYHSGAWMLKKVTKSETYPCSGGEWWVTYWIIYHHGVETSVKPHHDVRMSKWSLDRYIKEQNGGEL